MTDHKQQDFNNRRSDVRLKNTYTILQWIYSAGHAIPWYFVMSYVLGEKARCAPQRSLSNPAIYRY
jgi:hypothetical protein